MTTFLISTNEDPKIKSNSLISKHLATVSRKNFILTDRTLGTDPGSEVGGHLMGPTGLRGRERVRDGKR